MKYFTIIFTILLLFAPTSKADEKPKDKPILKQIAGLNVIKSIYPEAESVQKANSVWFRIISDKGDLIGYALSSKPFTKEIKGYHDATPVVVVMDKNKIIRKTAILSHYETTGFIRRLERQSFFDNWNGLTVEQAAKKRTIADSYTGATISANALMKNMDIILKMAIEDKL
jgi:Na+-translocating ferredoxin:NAD+ oxidoreductase RnfG subunit